MCSPLSNNGFISLTNLPFSCLLAKNLDGLPPVSEIKAIVVESFEKESNNIPESHCCITDNGFVNSTALPHLFSINGPDGLPTISAIQTMTLEFFEKTYSSIPETGKLAFLGKASLAAQKMSFDKREARDLLSLAVQLYAKNLKIDPLKLDTEESLINAKDATIKDLLLHSIQYSGGGKDSISAIGEIAKQAKAAFETWVIFTQPLFKE